MKSIPAEGRRTDMNEKELYRIANDVKENASFGATLCAERGAVAKAVSEGERKFRALAIASSVGEAMPCGICRQVLMEFEPDLRVITGKDEEHLESYPLSELLPGAFSLQK